MTGDIGTAPPLPITLIKGCLRSSMVNVQLSLRSVPWQIPNGKVSDRFGGRRGQEGEGNTLSTRDFPFLLR